MRLPPLESDEELVTSTRGADPWPRQQEQVAAAASAAPAVSAAQLTGMKRLRPLQPPPLLDGMVTDDWLLPPPPLPPPADDTLPSPSKRSRGSLLRAEAFTNLGGGGFGDGVSGGSGAGGGAGRGRLSIDGIGGIGGIGGSGGSGAGGSQVTGFQLLSGQGRTGASAGTGNFGPLPPIESTPPAAAVSSGDERPGISPLTLSGGRVAGSTTSSSVFSFGQGSLQESPGAVPQGQALSPVDEDEGRLALRRPRLNAAGARAGAGANEAPERETAFQQHRAGRPDTPRPPPTTEMQDLLRQFEDQALQARGEGEGMDMEGTGRK